MDTGVIRLVVTGVSLSLASKLGKAQQEDRRSTLSRECRDAMEFWVSVSPSVRDTLSRVARLSEGTGRQVDAMLLVGMLTPALMPLTRYAKGGESYADAVDRAIAEGFSVGCHEGAESVACADLSASEAKAFGMRDWSLIYVT